MINLYSEESQCCGCSACASICPKSAISMEENCRGFFLPVIDRDKCVECGQCLKVCDFKVFKPTEHTPQAYAYRSKDEHNLLTSQSGAASADIASKILSYGGTVFGACVTDGTKVIHAMATEQRTCACFKGSKYVQSDMNDCFKKCKEELLKDKYVLFTGTGCQVHGLLRYLDLSGVPTSKLYTADIICHGIGSSGIWKQYINLYEKKLKSKIVEVTFRDKSNGGWKNGVEKYTTADGRTLYNKNWNKGYFKNVILRDSCYVCKYTTPNRQVDFTLADLWGVEKQFPELNDNKGVSLVLVHTTKGKELLDQLNEKAIIKKVDLEQFMQYRLINPTHKAYDYNYFWKLYSKNPTKAIKRYFFPSIMMNVIVPCLREIKKKILVLKKLKNFTE